MIKILMIPVIALGLLLGSMALPSEGPQDQAPAPQVVEVQTPRVALMASIRSASVKLSDGVYGSGSGTVIMKSADGNTSYVLTAAHLLAPWHLEGGKMLVVHPEPDGFPRTFLATLVAHDEDKDLALFKVPDSPSLGQMVLHRNNDLKTGAEVWAVGFPLDVYPAHVTVGFVYKYRTPDGLPDPSWHIYHSAPIWYGNSGGALVDLESGEMVGVNVLIRIRWSIAHSDHAYAVPSEEIWSFLREEDFGSEESGD